MSGDHQLPRPIYEKSSKTGFSTLCSWGSASEWVERWHSQMLDSKHFLSGLSVPLKKSTYILLLRDRCLDAACSPLTSHFCLVEPGILKLQSSPGCSKTSLLHAQLCSPQSVLYAKVLPALINSHSRSTFPSSINYLPIGVLLPVHFINVGSYSPPPQCL